MLRPKCVRIQTIQSSCCASTACTSRAIGTGSPRIRSSCCVSMAGICNACVYRAVVAPRSQADRIAGSQHDELKRTRCFVPKACVHKAAAVLAVPESGCQAGSVALPQGPDLKQAGCCVPNACVFKAVVAPARWVETGSQAPKSVRIPSSCCAGCASSATRSGSQAGKMLHPEYVRIRSSCCVSRARIRMSSGPHSRGDPDLKRAGCYVRDCQAWRRIARDAVGGSASSGIPWEAKVKVRRREACV